MSRSLFLIPFIAIAFASTVSAQAPVPREPFDAAYQAWRDSMIKKDFAAWQKATAKYRQISLQNRINSVKKDFLTELFGNPLQAPQLTQLTLLDIIQKDRTASAVFFGKADFRVSDATEVKDNFIVVNFIEEDSVWKFDNLRIVKFGLEGDMMTKIRAGDHSFLDGEEFQPLGAVPKLPKLLPKPQRIGEIWITSVGFDVSVDVNRGNHLSQIANDFGKDIIIGGLRKGPTNHIALKIKPITVAADTKKHLEIAIYSAADGVSPASRVFHYRPDPEKIPVDYASAFSVNN